MAVIEQVGAREILDSRGNPDGRGRGRPRRRDAGQGGGAVRAPRPASTRRSSCATATPLRYGGKGVEKAVAAVLDEIGPELTGMEAVDQRLVDQRLVDLDGTPDKSRLGANALLGVSLAVAKAGAESSGLELFRYVGGPNAHVLPVPMMNIINGGAHADTLRRRAGVHDRAGRRGLVPRGAALGRGGLPRAEVGAEGQGPGHRARRRGRLRPRPAAAPGRAGPDRRGASTRPASRWAATSRWRSTWRPPSSTRRACTPTRAKLVHRGADGADLRRAGRRLPAGVHRGPAGRGRLGRLGRAHRAIGDKVQLVGDDLFVTNPERLDEGIARGAANALLVKVNQIGTLSETLDAVTLAHSLGLPLHDEPPLRRDRGHHDRRPGRRHRLRADQDRRAGPVRAGREVQPAAAHRGAARRRRPLRGRPGVPALHAAAGGRDARWPEQRGPDA